MYPFVLNMSLHNHVYCTVFRAYTNTLIALYFILIRYLMRSTFQPCIPEFKHMIQKYQFAWILQWLKSFPFDLCISLYNLTNHSYVFVGYCIKINNIMMTSSNGNIFRVTGLCARNSPVTGELPVQTPVTRSFDIFFDLRLNKRLRKQSWSWWFETISRSLRRHCNVMSVLT